MIAGIGALAFTERVATSSKVSCIRQCAAGECSRLPVLGLLLTADSKEKCDSETLAPQLTHFYFLFCIALDTRVFISTLAAFGISLLCSCTHVQP